MKRWLSWIACLFDPVRDLAWVMVQARFNLLVLLIILAVMVGSDQIQDELVRVGVDQPIPYLPGIYLTICWWAFNIFYWARFALDFDLRPVPLETCEIPLLQGRAHRIPCLILYVPRAMGASAFLVAIAGFVAAGVANDVAELYWYAGLLAVVGLVFCYAFIWRRRKLLNLTANALNRLDPKIGGAFAVADEPSRALRSWRDVPVNSWVFFGINALISVALLLGMILSPVVTARQFGTINIMLLGTTSWVVAGSLLVLFGEWSRVPVLALVAIYLFVISPLTDNHAVRHHPAALQTRPYLDPAFAGWNGAPTLHAELGGNPERAPVIVVATEGGGMRAAYWTAVLLSRVQQASPNFRDRLFAISGVSGGAVGATVFARLLRLDPTATACGATTPDQTLMACSRKILNHDTLDPAIGAFLYPDLVQWFLPVPFLPDRAAALEKGWESAWDDSVAADPGGFAGPFAPFEAKAGDGRVPVLLLNGTSVNTGKRLITSNIGVDDGSFPDTLDFLKLFNRTVRVSTAANNAARFPYIAPGGSFPGDGQVTDRDVDGGYFENFGAATAEDLIDHLDRDAVKHGRPLPWWIVIAISSDPDIGDYEFDEFSKGCPRPEAVPRPLRFATEITIPPAGLYATRTARGSGATKQLRYHVVEDLGGQFIPFRLSKPPHGAGPPLGWSLSRRARDLIDQDLAECPNVEALERVKQILAGAWAPAKALPR